MSFLLRTELLSPGDRVLVAVSGGADSLALLHNLATLRTELNITLIAAHVHHGMRGSEADADVNFLQALCNQLSVPLAVEYADVPALAQTRRVSLEEAGRDARYAAFRKLAREHQCHKVATAHHADDQAETLLLNLFRGTGLDGLRGIPERRPLVPEPDAPEVVRPLLQVWKRELEAYCEEHHLSPRLDYTNLDRYYRRNKIRHELLPLLEQFEPHLRRKLVRLADQTREEVEVLRQQAEQLLDAAVFPLSELTHGVPMAHPHPPDVLRLEVLRSAPAATLRRALGMLLRRRSALAAELDATLLQRLVEASYGRGPAAIDVPGCDLRVRCVGNRLVLECTTPTNAPEDQLLFNPGETLAEAWGLRLLLREAPAPDDLRLPPTQACFDAAHLHPPLHLRAPHRGDRFKPLGAPGHRLLSDLFADHKIPATLRSCWPVVVDSEGIAWVPGIASAERLRVHPLTQTCLHVCLEALGPRQSTP